MGLIGILIALGLLIWLAYRCWSILLLAPAASILAAGSVARAQDADVTFTTGVKVVPGATATTRIPCGASSTARVSVR